MEDNRKLKLKVNINSGMSEIQNKGFYIPCFLRIYIFKHSLINMNYFKVNTFSKPLKLSITIQKNFLNKVHKIAHTYTVLPPGLGLGGSE